MVDAAILRTWRLGARHHVLRARRRQELTALQTSRVRHADRPGRLGVPAVGGTRKPVPDRRHRPQWPHRGGAEDSDRRRARSTASRRPGPARGAACHQPDGSVVLRADGKGRRLRGQSRSTERVQVRGWRPGLLRRGSRAIYLAQPRRHSIRRRAVAARRSSCRARRRAGRTAMTAFLRQFLTPKRPNSQFSLGVLKLVFASLVLAVTLAPALTVRAQDQPDRSKPPALGPTPQLKLPAIQKRALSNGVPIWLVEAHEVPLVQVSLLVKAGAGDDPAGKFGLASMTAAMLDEGAGKRSALEIADEIEFLGADLSATGSFDASAVRLGVPVARLGPALSVMADVALRPTFPDAELERVRQERLTDLLQARDDPASVAPMAFARLLFGPSHRYGTGAVGTAATIKSFTTADMKSFHSAAYQPGNATLIVVGDVTADAVVPQLEQQFGAWRADGTPLRHATSPPPPQPAQRQIAIVDMPGAEQSQVRIGWVGVPRSTPDYFPLQRLHTILGGWCRSRREHS